MSLQRFMRVYNNLSREILGEPPARPKANKAHKNNVKKCKSCLFYEDGYCWQQKYLQRVDPLATACNIYQKRRR